MSTEIIAMEQTCTLNNILDEARSKPFTTFINNPLKEIRDVCIKGMESYSDIGTGFADQAEELIKRLKLVDWRYDYWKKILEWYLFAAEDEQILKRAIEFALSLYNEDPVINDNLVSKLLTGRLKNGRLGIEMYDNIPSLKAFFHGFLRNIYFNKWTGELRSGGYSESDWHLAARTLDIAVLADDFSLLWKIEEAIMLIKEGVIFPRQCSHWSANEMNLTLLETAQKLLEKAKRKAAAGSFE